MMQRRGLVLGVMAVLLGGCDLRTVQLPPPGQTSQGDEPDAFDRGPDAGEPDAGASYHRTNPAADAAYDAIPTLSSPSSPEPTTPSGLTPR